MHLCPQNNTYYSNMDNFEVLLLHRNKQFIKGCCDILNSQWERSETARLHSLELSTDDLPTSLVLVKKEENNCKVVLGHSRITSIPSLPDSCFIQSVVISKEHRRQGLGKYLMDKTEDYIKTLGLKTVYLSTIDQKEFYSKLGYVRSQPISIYGSFTAIINNMKTATNHIPCKKTFMNKHLM